MWDTVRDIRRGDGRGPQNEREGRNGSNAATSRTFFIWSNNSVLDCLTEANINQDLLEGKVNVNVVGRVRNTRAPSSPLLPVYEAIVNSIHAIDDVKTHDSLITIQIVRGQDAQKSLDDEDPARPGPVQGFIIRDNGVGFVDENYRSFVESDSQRKALLGGKGVGRFVWLKVFDRAEIESVFRDGSEFRRRYFRFELTPEGITNHRVEATDRGSRETVVRLIGLSEQYRGRCPRDARAIAGHIIDHCLEYFALGLCPAIRLEDPDGDGPIGLNDLYSDEFETASTVDELTVKGSSLKLQHVRLKPRSGLDHRIHFCAHKRSVLSKRLSSELIGLEGPLPADQGHFVYAGYVSGELLDDDVTSDRTSFHMYGDTEAVLGRAVGWDDVYRKSLERCDAYLSEFTSSVIAKKRERVISYVNNEAPHYRRLIKHREASINAIKPNLPDRDLEIELYKVEQEYDADLRRQRETLVSREEGQTFEVSDFMLEWNEAGAATLARYVAHRKATLELLDHRLGVDEAGKNFLEEAIHKMIFPMRVTSGDVEPDSDNLWIIDEKLSYHHFLASDLPFSRMKPAIESDSRKEPDLAIFKTASVFVEGDAPFQSVVIVEFKRPSRDDYDDKDNPIVQALDYIEQIKSSKAKNARGKTIQVPLGVRYYVYTVCDITSSLKKVLERRNFKLTPDGDGFFFVMETYNAYIEVVSYSKLLRDAKQRNRAFFHRLGIMR